MDSFGKKEILILLLFYLILNWEKIRSFSIKAQLQFRCILYFCEFLWETPGSKIMPVMQWSYHNHDETGSWSRHDGGIAAMFRDMVIMTGGMIMVPLPYFPWFMPCTSKKNGFFVYFFSISCCHKPLYATRHTLLAFEEILLPSQQNWTKITPKRISFPLC